MITVWIDELTPCLKDMETGLMVATKVAPIRRRSRLAEYTEDTGWYVNWQKLYDENDVFALTVAGTSEFQGLIALHDNPDPSMNAAYIAWMVAAPQNQKVRLQNGEPQKYSGVGGHLFAIAGRYSRLHGHDDGAVYGSAANQKLLRHYVLALGAEPIGTVDQDIFRFMICGKDMDRIEEVYTYDIAEF